MAEEILVKIVGDASGLSDALRRASSSMSSMNDEMKQKIGGVSSSFSSMSVTIGVATAALAGIGVAFKVAFSEAGRLDDISDATGLAIDKIVLFEKAAIMAGVGTDGMIQSVNRLNMVIGDAANGNEQAAKSIGRVGISVSDLIKMAPDERMTALAKAISQIDDQSLRASVSMDLFGKGGRKVVDALANIETVNLGGLEPEKINKSAEALNGLGDATKDFFSDIKIKTMVALGNAILFWRDALIGVKNTYKEVADESERVATISEAAAKKVTEQLKKDNAYRTQIAREQLKKEGEDIAAYKDARNNVFKSASDFRLSLMSDEAKENERYEQEQIDLNRKMMEAGWKDQQQDYDARKEMLKSHHERLADIAGKARLKEETERAAAAAKTPIKYDGAGMPISSTSDNFDPSKKGSNDGLVEGIFARVQTETEAEIAAYDQQRVELAAMDDAEFKYTGERDAAFEALEKDHQKKMSAIKSQAIKGDLYAYSSALGNLATLMNTKNREMFNIGKAAAIAQATLNTGLAISNVLAQDSKITGSAAIATAAAMGIACAVQVANIAATNFDGGGGGGSVGGGGVAVPIGSGQDGVPYGTGIGPTATPAQTINISIEGEFVSRDAVLKLIDQIRDAQKDGGNAIIQAA